MPADFLKENLEFLDRQKLMEPSVNGQVGFDFQGLRRSFKEDPSHPDSKSVAAFGRIWIYDAALSIYADLKAGRIRSAGYQAGRVMQLALQEKAKGFLGLWHFSYNTRGDSFIDPRGPTGANCWCLNALYSYALERGDAVLIAWANRAVEEFLFPQQVMDPRDPRYGLIRAGFHNADDVKNEDRMGYQVYEGDRNCPYEHVILEHCIDAAGTFRLAYRATRKHLPPQEKFLSELIHRHDLLMQGARRCFWQKDHFISALDPRGTPYTGTDGLPSVAVDNNTWAAYVFLPYDLEMARMAARYVEEHFLVRVPPAQVEDAAHTSAPEGMEGLYYFRSTFVDPFVQVPPEHRAKLEQMFQPEAALGFVLFLRALGLEDRARELYEHTVNLLGLYGSGGAPYASANIPMVFSTLSSVTTASSCVITSAILQGASADDFIGVLPPKEFTVAGKPPLTASA
ncbi:MAG: hypothetical protein Q7J69_06970 [Candidatus Omnitrophota bacterium]|nr:hypothetical protein [Candidatus Omnitrophota bacterium]